mmetsp:Transcript_28766/g.68653  ORF Transcript_28766/g.68653 Transcript_28766/m.68653 type:complete len:214 (-) Transcript_28766:414-1055(-)
MGRKHDVPDNALQHGHPLVGVVLDGLRLEDGLVTAADLEVVLRVSVVPDHELVVAELERLQVRGSLGRGLDRGAFDADLAGVVLLGGVPEGPRRDLLGENQRPHVVLAVEAQSDLVQDECNLLHLGHRAKRLHRHLLHDLCGFADLAGILLHPRQLPSESRPLDLDKDLPLSHGLQGLDELCLGLCVRGVLQVPHGLTDKRLDHLFELRPTFR